MNPTMKKLFSYVWPVTRHINSSANGIVEITWYNGKKLLDSQNANYSYGALQTLLTYGLSETDINPDTNILLLGLGGGSIIAPLREQFNCTGKITAVELDPVMIDIAEEEFDIAPSRNLEIVCMNALSYVKKCNTRFGLIIVDVFIDTQVPPKFYELEFWEDVLMLLKPGGSILFNVGINLENDDHVYNIIERFENEMTFKVFKDSKGVNTLLVGKK